MFYWIGFQSRNTGVKAVTNHLRDKHGLRTLQIVSAHPETANDLVEIDGDLTTYNFPANCVVEVYLGAGEPDPFATYVAQVAKV